MNACPATPLGTALPALLVWWRYRKESSVPSDAGEQTRFLWLWLAVPLVLPLHLLCLRQGTALARSLRPQA